MAEGVVLLTAYRINDAANLLTPKVISIPQNSIIRVIPVNSNDGVGYGTVVVSQKDGVRNVYRVFETPDQINVAIDPSDGKAIDKDLTVEAAGSTQGNGVDIVNYFNIVTAATDTSAEALDLDSATVGKVRVVYNSTGVALEVFPASGQTINGASANAVYDQAAYSRVTYVCKTAGAWVLATT